MSDLAKALKSEKLQGLRLRPSLTATKTSSLKAIFAKMRTEKKGYAVILESEKSAKVVGIFTERDVMTRVAGQGLKDTTTVEKVMTTNPTLLKITDTVASAIRLMNEGHYRHLPLVDDDGHLAGVLSVRDLITYLAEHFPSEVYNLPPNPNQVIRAPEGA